MTEPLGPPGFSPELGPELGSLVELTREAGDPELGLDAVRLDLVRHLFEQAEAARDFLGTNDPGGAKAALDKSVWLAAWQRAVDATAGRAIGVMTARLTRAAERSGFPARRLRELLPTDDDRAVLAAKLEAAAIPLEEAPAHGPGNTWWEDVRRRAARLEESWERLETVVRLELASQRERIDRVERWRPSRIPLVAGSALLVGFVTWVGLAVGGYLPRPGWLDGFTAWFWGLPWP